MLNHLYVVPAVSLCYSRQRISFDMTAGEILLTVLEEKYVCFDFILVERSCLFSSAKKGQDLLRLPNTAS